MPTISIPDFTDASVSNEADLMNRLEMLSKAVAYLSNNLDEDNVSRIITDVTTVKSAKGETVINGPLIQMYDTPADDPYNQNNFSSTGQLRVELGYDAGSSDFVFKMWSANGSTMFTLDSTGILEFLGTLRTGSTTGARIEISNNSLKTYNSTGELQGIAWGFGYSSNWGDVLFYDAGTLTMMFENQLGGLGWDIYCPSTSGALGLGYGGTQVLCSGTWNGLIAEADVTGAGGIPSHTHSIPSLAIDSNNP
jgi:hypothetical protein